MSHSDVRAAFYLYCLLAAGVAAYFGGATALLAVVIVNFVIDVLVIE